MLVVGRVEWRGVGLLGVGSVRLVRVGWGGVLRVGMRIGRLFVLGMVKFMGCFGGFQRFYGCFWGFDENIFWEFFLEFLGFGFSN